MSVTTAATASTAAPGPGPMAEPVRFVLRGLASTGFGVAIAVGLTLAFGSSLWLNLAQSVCISICCWFTIDALRLLAARWVHRHDAPPDRAGARRWPGWPWMLFIIVVGGVGGYALGTAAADGLTGQSGPSLMRGLARGSAFEITSVLVLSLIPSLAITYWFYSREMIALHEAASQSAQRQAAEHQLKLLESQLEPHMLFNTLANLRVLIGMDPLRAQVMLDQLIGFLRATLDGSRAGQHPLRAEFLRVSDYLALMQVRMGERLHTRLELPPPLEALAVPPLLLQPLVENCIKHGLEPAVSGGRIDVRAQRDGATLVLTVRDTGIGLAASGDREGTRFGLLQVRERLATLYGAAASLTLAPAGDAEGGTLATIRLPIAAA